MNVFQIDPANIVIGERARALRDDAVEPLMESMRQFGLRTPIAVRIVDEAILRGAPCSDVPILVAGRHRLEAALRLGWTSIDAIEIADERDARLWEISENLHRCELSPVERAEHIDEWRRLTVEKGQQDVAPNGGHQPHDRGHYKTAEKLGVSHAAVRRAERIAALPPEVRDQARAEGWTQKRLLEAAAPPKPVRMAPEPRNALEAVEAQVARLMAAWNAAGPEAREQFIERAGI